MITSTTDLKKYISVTANFNFEAFEPYIEKAAMTYTVKYIGLLHKTLQNVGSDEHESLDQVRDLLDAALANFAMCLYFPFYQITLGNTGPQVAQNDKTKNPDWWQVKDARRELLRSGHQYLDALLTLLDANANHFSDWKDNYQSKYKELLVNNADVFSMYYEIFSSRQTYLALVPTIRQVEQQYIKTVITSEKLTRLKTAIDLNADEKEVKAFLQQSIVAFTIATVYDRGIFNLDQNGLKIRFDVLPDEKVQAIDYGFTADQIKRTINTLIQDGTNYIKLAKEIITTKGLTGYIAESKSTPTTVIGSGGVIGL